MVSATCGSAPSPWWPPSPFLLGPPLLGCRCPGPPSSGVAGPKVSQSCWGAQRWEGSRDRARQDQQGSGRWVRSLFPVPGLAQGRIPPQPLAPPWATLLSRCGAAPAGGELVQPPLRPHVILPFEAGFVLSVLFPGWKPLRLLPRAPLQLPTCAFQAGDSPCAWGGPAGTSTPTWPGLAAWGVSPLSCGGRGEACPCGCPSLPGWRVDSRPGTCVS